MFSVERDSLREESGGRVGRVRRGAAVGDSDDEFKRTLFGGDSDCVDGGGGDEDKYFWIVIVWGGGGGGGIGGGVGEEVVGFRGAVFPGLFVSVTDMITM